MDNFHFSSKYDSIFTQNEYFFFILYRKYSKSQHLIDFPFPNNYRQKKTGGIQYCIPPAKNNVVRLFLCFQQRYFSELFQHFLQF